VLARPIEEKVLKSAKKTGVPVVEVPWENPLIPTKRLRELYTAMAELRLLEEHIDKLQRKVKPASRLEINPGEEACRVSTALSLLPGDITSDPAPGIATRFLRGAKLADIVQYLKPPTSISKPATTELPFALDPERRVLLAIGAALALAANKKDKKEPLVVTYIYPGELPLPEWKPLFRLAASHSAPIIFVALPSSFASHKPGKLSELSTVAGVPGIPVDAADAVALYRVVQESMVRARAGGGPVLMECIPFQLPGGDTESSDPVFAMRASLIHRKIADEAWFNSVETRFTSRLKATKL
jgi:TPP-dependent pyruvate/acetoin dehydrogenase alpha subunit